MGFLLAGWSLVELRDRVTALDADGHAQSNGMLDMGRMQRRCSVGDGAKCWRHERSEVVDEGDAC